MSTYYRLEKEVNDTTFRGVTFYTNGDNNDKYKIYYNDSEWKDIGIPAGTESTGSFTDISNFFQDGITWNAKYNTKGLGSQSEPQYKFIVVRLSDRKTGLFTIRGTSGFPVQHVVNAGDRTVTDVTEHVWYDELRKLSLLGYI